MEPIQPPFLDPSEAKNPDTQSVANQPKHSDTLRRVSDNGNNGSEAVQMRDEPAAYRINTNGRSMLPAMPRRRSQRAHIGPAKWAEAMNRFVSGELTTIEMVREWLGCGTTVVRRRAETEGWMQARDRRAEALRNRAIQLPELGVEREAGEIREIGRVQAEIAKGLLEHAKGLQGLANESKATMANLQARIDSAAMGERADDCLLRRLTGVQSLHAQLVDQIRVLAGLQHPDKARPAPVQHDAAKPSPTKTRPEPTGPISKPVLASPLATEQDQDTDTD